MDAFYCFVALPTAALSALAGGSLFGFSTLVVPALRQMPSQLAIRAMQQINKVAPRSLLMVPVLGSTVGCLGIAAWTGTHHNLVATRWLWLGSVCGIASFTVTGSLNVPENRALARLDPGAGASVHFWLDYITKWSLANHLRTILSLTSGGALGVAVHLASNAHG